MQALSSIGTISLKNFSLFFVAEKNHLDPKFTGTNVLAKPLRVIDPGFPITKSSSFFDKARPNSDGCLYPEISLIFDPSNL